MTDDAAASRFKRLGLGVAVLGGLVILAFAGSSAYDAWSSYRYSVAATNRELTNVANALAEQTAWTLQSVDLVLMDTARMYAAKEVPPERLNTVLANRLAGLRQLRELVIADAQGNQLFSSLGSGHTMYNIADRSYFIAQRDSAQTRMFMSEPLVTRSGGRAAVVLSRRINDQSGNFAGIVEAVFELEDLKNYYQAANPGMGSAVQLVRDDGTVLARNPSTPNIIGQQFRALVTSHSPPAWPFVNPIDGHADFIALARVRNASLALAVTRQEGVALRPWREETLRVAVRTLVLTLLAAIILAALVRQIRRGAAVDRALRESEERYALAMEGANEGHWDWDLISDHVFLSPKMLTLYGLGTDRVIQTRSEWFESIHFHPDDRPRFDATRQAHFEGLTPRYDIEYRIRLPDGDWRWLRARGRCVRDRQGKPIRFVGSSSDVTEYHQAQLDKEGLEAQLRQSQKMEAIGTLAGGIAHDFNNILGAILGYSELAQQQSAEGTPLRRYLDNVLHAAERAKILIERILGFSRSGLGDRIPVNIQFVVEETLELLAASLPAGIRLESTLACGDAAVIGDATHLHQVVMNLCTNAIQSMEIGGVLRVALERTDVINHRVLSRGALRPGPYARLIVSDTGIGIAPAVLERMFDPFFTTKGVGQGTGLGLSLVLGIVSDLGGAIEVMTRTGEGTSFEIWCPIAGETVKPGVAAAAAPPRGKGQIVMIVDDEPALVALAEEITAELGYEPVGFDSSSAALQAFRAAPQSFDVLLTDEAMPDLVGIELAREVRRLRPDLPIIIMSGYGGAQLTNRAAKVGISEVLRKPVHRRELAEALARALSSDH